MGLPETGTGGTHSDSAGATATAQGGAVSGSGLGAGGDPQLAQGGALSSGGAGAGEAGAGEAGAGKGGAGASCDDATQIMFVVSRSGGMFLGNPAPWHAIREVSLTALKQVEGLAELGFLAVTGETETCPVLEEVAPKASNYNAIASMYGALGEPVKGESPFMWGLDRAGKLLTGAGKKYIVFVLNGEPDYCNDSYPGCPTDSVIAHIQALHAAGITTLVASAPSLLLAGERLAAYEAAVQSYANAGVGLPTGSHEQPATLNIMCASGSDAGAAAWRNELAASGKPDNATLADYSETPGDAPHLTLDPMDMAGMTSALSALLKSIAGCE